MLSGTFTKRGQGGIGERENQLSCTWQAVAAGLREGSDGGDCQTSGHDVVDAGDREAGREGESEV